MLLPYLMDIWPHTKASRRLFLHSPFSTLFLSSLRLHLLCKFSFLAVVLWELKISTEYNSLPEDSSSEQEDENKTWSVMISFSDCRSNYELSERKQNGKDEEEKLNERERENRVESEAGKDEKEEERVIQSHDQLSPSPSLYFFFFASSLSLIFLSCLFYSK